jgi:hypothetical protein
VVAALLCAGASFALKLQLVFPLPCDLVPTTFIHGAHWGPMSSRTLTVPHSGERWGHSLVWMVAPLQMPSPCLSVLPAHTHGDTPPLSRTTMVFVVLNQTPAPERAIWTTLMLGCRWFVGRTHLPL